MGEVVPTACTNWSLNEDPESKLLFWWNNTYNISIWNSNLKLKSPYDNLDDNAVWQAFIDFQIHSVFKLCPICRLPEENEDMKVCCYCGQTVHDGCSKEASHSQMEWKPANRGFEAHICVCFACENIEVQTPISSSSRTREACSVRRAATRALTIKDEYPQLTTDAIVEILRRANQPPPSSEEKGLMASLRKLVTSFFQSEKSLTLLKKSVIKAKGGGLGIVAVSHIPALTVIGVYPGYVDALSGEQAKFNRPIAKYALMELNCADYYNVVFDELQSTFTPFINEPCESEMSNCAWIQETKHITGRLSVITTRDIEAGEELLICYGPRYPRSYPYRYDALSFHEVETESNNPCFALWHWLSNDEKGARLESYVEYDTASDTYAFMEHATTSEQENVREETSQS